MSSLDYLQSSFPYFFFLFFSFFVFLLKSKSQIYVLSEECNIYVAKKKQKKEKKKLSIHFIANLYC